MNNGNYQNTALPIFAGTLDTNGDRARCDQLLKGGSSIRMFTNIRLSTVIGIALIFGATTHRSAGAQVQGPSNPDNMLTPSSPIGTPPHVPTYGADENVNLSNGALTTYIPLLSVPQRGGWSLPFAFVHSSSGYYLEQDLGTQTEFNSQGSCETGTVINCFYTKFSYASLMVHPDPIFNVNLPRLQSSSEYVGDYVYRDATSPVGFLQQFCVTNFRFTDWEGSVHPFAVTQSCNQPLDLDERFEPATLGESTDGSFYRIDLTNADTTGIVTVTSKSGTVYTFNNFNLYQYPTPPAPPGPTGGGGSNTPCWYDSRMSSMVDTNGNQITVAAASNTFSPPICSTAQQWTVTDTLGRIFNFGFSGLTQTDASNVTTTIASLDVPSPAIIATITGYSASSGVATFTVSPQLPTAYSSGDSVAFSGFTAGARALNGQSLAVLASPSPTTSSFAVATNAISGSGSDAGQAAPLDGVNYVTDVVQYAEGVSNPAPFTSSITTSCNTQLIVYNENYGSPSTCKATGSPGPVAWQATLTFPAADVSGTARTFSFELDAMMRIAKVTYPEGGYTRYDYAPQSLHSWAPYTLTTYPFFEVSHKYDCTKSAGCTPSQEYVTTFEGTIGTDSSHLPIPYNSSIKVTDPLGNITTTSFSQITPQEIAPKVTDIDKANSSNTSLWHQNTAYYPPPNFSLVNTDLYLPQTVTTTLNDAASSPKPSSTVTYAYDTYPAPIAAGFVISVNIDNPMNITETDFDGTTKRTTAETWSRMTYNSSNGAFAGTFTASGGHILDRMLSKTVADNVQSLTNSTVYAYDNGANTVGNLTNKSISATNAPTASTQYTVNAYGQVTKIVDPKLNPTNLSYDMTAGWAGTRCVTSSSGSAYITQVTDALGQHTSYTYNSCFGTIASVTGPNGDATSYNYDSLQRVTSASYLDSGKKVVCYFDSVPNTVVTYSWRDATQAEPSCSSEETTETGSIAQSVVLDGFGRNYQSTLLSDPDGATTTTTTYDGDGNVQSMSIPFRSLANSGYTTSFTYDALNRKRFAYNPDSTSTGNSSFKLWSYSGNITTFQDENGNRWQKTTDAFGNLVTVLEPSGSSTSPTLETDYGYDGFGNLWSVTQLGGAASSGISRLRTFVYDGMSRLRSATNPENGTTTYIYDANGNLTSKTAPAPNSPATSMATVTTNYSYDALNRLFSKTYTNDNYRTPWTCLQYGTPTTATNGANQIDRLMSEWLQSAPAGSPSTGGTCPPSMPSSGVLSARRFLSYDLMGRVLSEQQCTPTNCNSSTQYALASTYDRTGNLYTYTNGIPVTPGSSSNPLTFTRGIGDSNRLMTLTSSWSDSLHPSTLLSAQPSPGNGYAYSPAGALQSAILGLNGQNGITLSRQYDTRQRITNETDYDGTNAPATASSATITITGAEQLQ